MEFLVWVDVCLQFEEMEFMYKQVYQVYFYFYKWDRYLLCSDQCCNMNICNILFIFFIIYFVIVD